MSTIIQDLNQEKATEIRSLKTDNDKIQDIIIKSIKK